MTPVHIAGTENNSFNEDRSGLSSNVVPANIPALGRTDDFPSADDFVVFSDNVKGTDVGSVAVTRLSQDNSLSSSDTSCMDIMQGDSWTLEMGSQDEYLSGLQSRIQTFWDLGKVEVIPPSSGPVNLESTYAGCVLDNAFFDLSTTSYDGSTLGISSGDPLCFDPAALEFGSANLSSFGRIDLPYTDPVFVEDMETTFSSSMSSCPFYNPSRPLGLPV